MTTPNIRDVLKLLIEAVVSGTIPDIRDAITTARTALAEPVPPAAGEVQERPTDEELTLTYAYAVAAAVGNKRGPFKKEDAEAAQLAGLRAVLARWGYP